MRNEFYAILRHFLMQAIRHDIFPPLISIQHHIAAECCRSQREGLLTDAPNTIPASIRDWRQHSVSTLRLLQLRYFNVCDCTTVLCKFQNRPGLCTPSCWRNRFTEWHDSLPFFRLHRAQIVAISDSIYDTNIVNRTKANIPFSGVASFNIFYCGFELSSPRWFQRPIICYATQRWNPVCYKTDFSGGGAPPG